VKGLGSGVAKDSEYTAYRGCRIPVGEGGYQTVGSGLCVNDSRQVLIGAAAVDRRHFFTVHLAIGLYCAVHYENNLVSALNCYVTY
jgi:hypothetical protein